MQIRFNTLVALIFEEPLEIFFAGWQAGHGDAKHLVRVGLLLRAPALKGCAPPCRAGTARSRTANNEKTKFRCRLTLAKPALSDAAKATYRDDRCTRKG